MLEMRSVFSNLSNRDRAMKNGLKIQNATCNLWYYGHREDFIAQVGVASSSASIKKHFMLVARLVDKLIEIGEMVFPR